MGTPLDKVTEAESLLQELERLETKLQMMQERIDRAHRLVTLGTMATAIAHEFNNILTPVVSYCQMATQSPELKDKALQRALQGALRATQISQSMLGFVRNPDAAAADVREVLDDTLNCMAQGAGRDSVEIICQISAGCTAAISPIHLQQVLMNLILNARTAMPGGGRIHISAHSNDLYTNIDVKDSGIGIPEKLMDEIFEPFVTSGEQEGTGLGLSICRELIERASGTIAVMDTGPSGTTFQICLPVASSQTA
jgi:signal transduction histidine kinase